MTACFFFAMKRKSNFINPAPRLANDSCASSVHLNKRFDIANKDFFIYLKNPIAKSSSQLQLPNRKCKQIIKYLQTIQKALLNPQFACDSVSR